MERVNGQEPEPVDLDPQEQAPLVPAPSADAMEQAMQMRVELEMLREFYECWEEMHRVAKAVAAPRRAKEIAAQRLVDAAQSLRGFYVPVRHAPKLEVIK
jgi:hypothetical protein